MRAVLLGAFCGERVTLSRVSLFQLYCRGCFPADRDRQEQIRLADRALLAACRTGRGVKDKPDYTADDNYAARMSSGHYDPPHSDSRRLHFSRMVDKYLIRLRI